MLQFLDYKKKAADAGEKDAVDLDYQAVHKHGRHSQVKDLQKAQRSESSDPMDPLDDITITHDLIARAPNLCKDFLKGRSRSRKALLKGVPEATEEEEAAAEDKSDDDVKVIGESELKPDDDKPDEDEVDWGNDPVLPGISDSESDAELPTGSDSRPGDREGLPPKQGTEKPNATVVLVGERTKLRQR